LTVLFVSSDAIWNLSEGSICYYKKFVGSNDIGEDKVADRHCEDFQSFKVAGLVLSTGQGDLVSPAELKTTADQISQSK